MEVLALEGVLEEVAALACDDEYAARLCEMRASTSLQAISAAVGVLAEARDEDVRLAAAQFLGTGLGDHLAARRIESVAVAARGELEMVAAELGRVRSPDAIPTLRALAGHRDPAVREGAAVGLGHLAAFEPSALDVLAFLAGDHEPGVRARAIDVLGDIDVDTPRLRDVLAGALEDEDAEVRFEAARHLGERGDPRAIEAILDLWCVRREFGTLEPAVIRLAAETADRRLRPLIAGLDPWTWSESGHSARFRRARERYAL